MKWSQKEGEGEDRGGRGNEKEGRERIKISCRRCGIRREARGRVVIRVRVEKRSKRKGEGTWKNPASPNDLALLSPF